MEELLPNLQTMLLPKMKGKRNDRKRAWFGVSTVLRSPISGAMGCFKVSLIWYSTIWVLWTVLVLFLIIGGFKMYRPSRGKQAGIQPGKCWNSICSPKCPCAFPAAQRLFLASKWQNSDARIFNSLYSNLCPSARVGKTLHRLGEATSLQRLFSKQFQLSYCTKAYCESILHFRNHVVHLWR